MDRRVFTGGLAFATLTVPCVAHAQPARKVYRIGMLLNSATPSMVGPQPLNPSVKAFLRGLRELGYIYGEHFVTEPRGSEGQPERFPSLAAELIRLQVDMIAAAGPALPALKQATSRIPVIMAASLDPVAQGYVQSLAHPGANFTGLSLQSVETTGKRLELLKELVPGSAPVAVLWNETSLLNLRAAEVAARERGWRLLSLEIRYLDDIERTFRAATDTRAGALLVFAAGLLFPHARRVAELAAKNRIPAMYELPQYVEAGGLICYGPDINDVWRRATAFADKIIKGAKPADLPIEQPTKFVLVINLKTAKALGLTIPQPILARADEVIQ